MAFFRCGTGSGGTTIVAPEITGSFGNANGLQIQNGKYIRNFGTGANDNSFYPRTSSNSAPVYDFSKDFHMRLKVKFTGTFSGGQRICDPLIIYFRQSGTGNRAVVEWLDINNAINYIRVGGDELNYTADTWYTIDLESISNVQTFTITDGVTTVTKTEHFAQHAAMTNQRFGNIDRTNLSAVFDFSDCFFEQDGVILWGNRNS